MAYDITIQRSGGPEPALGWTTVWDSAAGVGDWRIAAPADASNPGGLAANGQIASAVILSLFTDRRAPEGWRPEVADRGGWWGDYVAAEGEPIEETGSWLWLLRNEVATQDIADQARVYAEIALAWMLRDRVVARIDVASGLIEDPRRGVWLQVSLYGRDGVRVFDSTFARLWREV